MTENVPTFYCFTCFMYFARVGVMALLARVPVTQFRRHLVLINVAASLVRTSRWHSYLTAECRPRLFAQ